MLKIALTGNLGSGKSTVGRFFQEAGFHVLDADRIIRSFYEEKGEVYRKVVEAFGDRVLDREGNIDRKTLAQIVFSDPQSLRLLESITHSELYRRLDEEFRRLPQKSIVVVEASLLIEKGTYRNYHITLLVYAPYQLCRERALKAGYSPEDFERRWANQMPPEEKKKYAHFIVENTQTLEALRSRVFELARVFKNWVEFQHEELP